MMRRGIVIAAVAVVSAILWTAAYRVTAFTWGVAAELDDATALAELAPRPQTTIVYDIHGRPAFTFFIEQRINVPLEQVSPAMVQALLAVEDQRFFSHNGLDAVRIAAAGWNNVRAHRIVEGGSTLTQQLARAGQL